MWLFLAFLLVPLIEIALFVKVGGAIGLWPTLFVVVATAAIGAVLVRRQGLRALARLREAIERLEDPGAPLADGAMILFAGALLLTPGFLTDSIGFLLLVPALRQALARAAGARMQRSAFGPGPDPADDVVEGRAEDVTETGWPPIEAPVEASVEAPGRNC